MLLVFKFVEELFELLVTEKKSINLIIHNINAYQRPSRTIDFQFS